MSKIKRALRKIAKQEGISVEEVYREMQTALDAGFQNPDPAIRALWQAIPMPCARPRPEDVIQYCVQKVKE